MIDYTKLFCTKDNKVVFVDNARYMDGYHTVANFISDNTYSLEFALEILDKAAYILADNEDATDIDELAEGIESALYIYNAEIVKIYAHDWQAVDEACEEMCEKAGTTITRAQCGWYSAITNACEALLEGRRDDNEND